MLQVCPSIVIRRLGLSCSARDRFVERPRRFRPEAVAVEVEVDVLEDDFFHRFLDHLDGDHVGRAAPLPSSTRTVTGTGPSTIGAVHGVCRADALVSEPAAALHA